MSNNIQKSNEMKLLWIDDDPQKRFRSAARLLNNEGWTIEWAKSILDAARRLSKNTYKGVILDQMLPPEEEMHNAVSMWGGCMLFYWLRGEKLDNGFDFLEFERTVMDKLKNIKPKNPNKLIKIIVISALYDPKIYHAFFKIDPQINILPKPFNRTELAKKIRPC